MNVDELTELLDNACRAEDWLRSTGISHLERAHTNWLSIARSGMTLDEIAFVAQQVEVHLPGQSDPDRALNNLEKFIAAARSPLALGALFQRDPTALPILLMIFSTSQHLSDLLIRDTESYDTLRLTEGQLYSRNILVDELRNSMATASEAPQAMQILRRFKHRETLRIAFGDLIAQQRIEQIAQQISFVADAIIEAAFFFAAREWEKQWGVPQTSAGARCRLAVLALGKLGGTELNYSSDIDLIVVYEAAGQTSQSQKPNQSFFERVTRDAIKLLNESTALGAAYRVDMRLRPGGSRGPICCHASSFLRYYDLQGRTWERQAMIKARPVAADLQFGGNLLAQLGPWVYQPILNRFDIAEIRALKRQIEHRAVVSGEEKTNVKTGHGGIRDIEFAIQFLQLLNGDHLPSIRNGNTLEAIEMLSQTGCLNRQEATLLTQNYGWLRKLEHRLQIMFDLQTHTLPESEVELERTAKRMGYVEYFGRSPLEQFKDDLQEVTDINNRILHHLLHGAFFHESQQDEDEDASGAADLILQPDLTTDEIDALLTRHRFREAAAAAQMLQKLGEESTAFLSFRRCRHFLAAIANTLLAELGRTPDPDATLVSLSNVADALGGKGALWELFNFHRPSLELFVRLCATSDYLCTIIRRNPGMIDELIDSLLMNELPSIEWLRLNLDDLITGAEDPARILHSFKMVRHLRVGVRDTMGRDPTPSTHRALADIAEVCVEKIAELEFETCAAKYARSDVPRDQLHKLNGLSILALGKLGGREPNYHSDLDVMFLYDDSEHQPQWLQTSKQHFYSELAAQITRAVTTVRPIGKLFDLDSRLRPGGKSAALAVSLKEFQRYFDGRDGQLWERQALCKARPVFGATDIRERVMHCVGRAIKRWPWEPQMAVQIREMRFRMQESCSPRNIKRGNGGTVDIEFIVQMLQIKHARDAPQVLVPGTIEAIEALTQIEAIEQTAGTLMSESYQFLRGVESRLRLTNATARHDLPTAAALEKLAFLLETSAEDLEQSVANYRQNNRQLFESFFA